MWVRWKSFVKFARIVLQIFFPRVVLYSNTRLPIECRSQCRKKKPSKDPLEKKYGSRIVTSVKLLVWTLRIMQGWDPCFSPWFFSSTSFFLGGGGWRRELQGIYMAVLLRRKIVYRPFKIEESGTVQIFFLSLVAIDAPKTWKKKERKTPGAFHFFHLWRVCSRVSWGTNGLLASSCHCSFLFMVPVNVHMFPLCLLHAVLLL